MRISSFNINKFCGAYGSSLEPVYYNPRNVDFKSKIKEIVDSLLVETDDIVFLQEFIDNQYISGIIARCGEFGIEATFIWISGYARDAF